MAKKETVKDVLIEEAYLSEGYLVGLFWQYPDFYAEYSEDKLNKKTFGNFVYAFYFSLGRRMYEQGFHIFDDVCAYKVVSEFKAVGDYEELGGYETVQQLMEEAQDKKDNIEGYYETVKKYEMLRQLRGILGDKVIEQNGKYDYRFLSGPQISRYWIDAINQVGMENSANVDEEYLLEGLDEAIIEWSEKPDIGLEFFDSPKMTNICDGMAYGHLYLNAAFSGKGKTSIAMSKVIMSCIVNKEKLLVCANEQSRRDFQKLMFVTAFGILGIKFDRQRLNKGNFTEEEFKALNRAKKWIKSIISDEKNGEKLIVFAFLQEYSLENLRSTIRHYANRGYRRVIIDTAKPSENNGSGMSRWEIFSTDVKEIYKLARPNAGGLNLCVFINAQLADSALGQRYLDEMALGDSKKIKNECSTVFLWRSVWDDERESGNYELKVTRQVKISDKDEFNEDDGEIKPVYKTIETTIPNDGKPYYLMFTSKNRRGLDNSTGLDVLVFAPDFNLNKWNELGWCKVYRDRNYGR